MASTLNRIFTAFGPPIAEKRGGALKFGILGAANIVPLALITPAKSHPEVVVQAIAARDRSRAEAFAKKHGIPEVKDSYQDILDDPKIDVIFIPLPNALHFEWAVRSIRAGKHVLLEKPSVSTATEANILFNLPELSRPTNAPVLLEAFHNRFHPAVHLFLSFISPADVTYVHTDAMVPWWLTKKGDIGFNYAMAGGSIMHMGTYCFAMLRDIFQAEPTACESCETTVFGDGVHDLCDYKARATFRFPNGGVGEAEGTLRGPTVWKPSEARVTHREVVVRDDKLPGSQEKVRTRVVTMHGFLHAIFWHRIDVRDEYVVREKAGRRVVRKWVEMKSHKAYTFKGIGEGYDGVPGEDWWMSYRYQLEEFVNRVKGRKTRTWIDGDDSVKQARMIDMAYEKTDLGLRPTSSFK